jgi:hypothetical protein
VRRKVLYSAVLYSETLTFSKAQVNQRNKEASICNQLTTLVCVINSLVLLFLNNRVATILGAHRNRSSRRSMITLSAEVLK